MKMTKFEDKILEWLKGHRIILGYALITVLNLFLRKIAVWWTVDGVVSYYDGHEHMIQGQLWWLIMRAGMVFPRLPVHFMKWIAEAGDFAMASAGALAISKGFGGPDGSGACKGNPERGLVFYAVVLIMPFTLLRGIVWSMTDSIGIACFLWAWCFAKKDVTKCGAYVIGMLFCPALVLALVAEGIFGQVNFLSYEASEGVSFEGGGEWLMQQLWLYCLPVSVWGVFKILRRV